MNLKKYLCIGLAITMSAGIFSGCDGKGDGQNGSSLKMWCQNYVNKYISNYGEIEAFQKLQENTGIKVEYVHPVTGQEKEQFNVLVASGDLPDIIEYNWGTGYPGGAEKAIKDGIIVPIEEYVDEFAPNYKRILNENKELEKSTISTDGKQLLFHSLKEDYEMNSYSGPTIRKDWLDQLSLPVPETMEDWYQTLKAFKEKDPNGNEQADEIPLTDDKTMTFKNFAAAWGCLSGAFYKNAKGEFVYGSIEPEYKEFLAEMNKWYKEGLLDPEFASATRKNLDARITTDVSGAYVGMLGSQMGNYLAARSGDGKFNLIGTPWPKGAAGIPYCPTSNVVKLATFGYGAAITKSCKDVKVAMKYLDYCYSDEGYDLQNWGIEGVTYQKTDAGKKYTDLILHNPEGKDPIQAMVPYAVPAYGGAKMMGSEPYLSFMYNLQQQKDAASLWAKGDNSLLLPSYSTTAEEAKKFSSIMDDIKTYEEEMFTKMVMGTVPISEFDNYVAKIKKMGIDEAIAVQKQVYERNQ